MPKATGRLCAKHGVDCHPGDAFWLCDECARKDIKACACGSPARYFGEAMMCAVGCEACAEHVMYVGFDKDVRALWNQGERGAIK